MELIYEQSKKYFEAGFSVVPTNAQKVAIGAWKIRQSQVLPPTEKFKEAAFIAFVCGSVNAPIGLGLEVVDIDLKYDVTGTMFKEYKKIISDNSPDLLKKLVVQQTKSGGYHFIYYCKKYEGNQKLAKRPATKDELDKNPKETALALFETRGEGGYFIVSPSEGYKVVYGDLLKINEITEDERGVLFSCAKSFNTYAEPFYEKNYVKENTFQEGLSPFDDYNRRGDVHEVLKEAGWNLSRVHGEHNYYLRPSGTGMWSADWSEKLRLFYVWTTSSEFDSEKAYNATHILTKLKFGGDFKAASKWLYDNGFGDRRNKPKEAKKINDDFDINDFVAAPQEADEMLYKVWKQEVEMGLVTGIPTLDPHFLFKHSHYNVINGHDNVGKSVFIWYLSVLSAIKHDWNWLIYSSENSLSFCKRKLMEFYLCKKLTSFTQEEYYTAKGWVEQHFTLIKQPDLVTYKDLIMVGDVLSKEKRINGFVIDPYNSLYMPNGMNRHDWDTVANIEMRNFTRRTKCSIYLNCHAYTDAIRKLYPKGHDYEGHQLPPQKADTEGGSKFASKADDFLTIHRLPQHEKDWMWTQVHVRKIKEAESGGKHTYMDKPVRLRMLMDNIGFVDSNGYNPVTTEQTGLIDLDPRDSTVVSNADKFIEPVKVETWDSPDIPF